MTTGPRTRHTLLPSGCALVACALLSLPAGCDESGGGGDTTPEVDASTLPSGPLTRAEIIEAAIRMHSCEINKGQVRISGYLNQYDEVYLPDGLAEMWKTIYRCVNAAKGDCKQALACFKSDNEKTCDNSYEAVCDGDVLRTCDLGDKRVYEYDCAAGGLTCVKDAQGRPFCGAGPCTKDGEVKCDGERRLACNGTGYEIEECTLLSLTCGLDRDGVFDCIGTGKECKG